jgi:phage tail sheath protein FI
MPVQVSYPGVYVQEQGSGARAIAAVPTANTVFIGMAEQGRMGLPVQIQTYAQFENEFGTTTSGELADQVRQFFTNGGATAFICRIANDAHNAKVTLQSESGNDVLVLTARDPGLLGNMIRAQVDYGTADPERTFNLTLFRRTVKPDGSMSQDQVETFKDLSMDPTSVDYVKTRLNGISTLATADVVNPPANAAGVSMAARILPSAAASVETDIDLAVTDTNRSIRIAVGQSRPVQVALSETANIANADDPANIAAKWTQEINDALNAAAVPHNVVVEISGTGVNNGGIVGGRVLTISCADGSVRCLAASGGDVTAGLGLGVMAGGVEGDAFGDTRPAPTGIVGRNGTSANGFDAFRRFLGARRDQLTGFTLTDDSGDAPHSNPNPMALGGNVPMADNGTTRSAVNARAELDVIAAAVEGNSNGRWTVRRTGNRLALTPRYGSDNTGLTTTLATSGGVDLAGANMMFANIATNNNKTPSNVPAYTIGLPGGIGGQGQYQGAAVAGDDGDIPKAQDYLDAFAAIEQGVDLFNLMVLPRANGQSDAARQSLWGIASAFCAEKRAFLIVDPRSSWITLELAEAEIDQLRIGLETRNSAAYWPRLRIDDGTPTGKLIDPAGSVAGLMARVDANRGVWKAPAGLEATIRGVTGLERRLTDPENGSINPKALNALRVFPAGVVGWGARTLVGFDGSGDIDDKYVPVRRTMLFIEESLYRGLHFAVFEPNDEPLWAQIRLAAGSFMRGLFRQGAFAGAKTTDAYFVACDATTTTGNDINLGVVNVVVGFAPLKPAEFVILTVKQIAGQVQV